MALKKANILIVDDDYDMLELVQRHLQELHFHSYKASSVVEAINILKFNAVDLIITDLQMPGIGGLELIKYVDEHFPEVPKLVITGYPSIDGALNAIKSGALDYLVKPFTFEELKNSVQKSLPPQSLQDATPSTSSPTRPNVYAGIVGNSDEIEKLIDLIERVKNNRATVLIQGESGTGKELVARAIHYKGSFAANPFIAVNCGAIPEELLEAELFGYKKGAFTGANENREGFFQAAAGGTIFLDEIGTASPTVQTRLLRVLQEKEVRRVGEQKAQKIEIRIIAATNSNLLQMSQNGSFREDLYYRLNVVNIITPPLRDHKGDIPSLAKNFLRKYASEYAKPKVQFSSRALEMLKRYNWPGNVRELENVVQRAIIMSEELIDIAQLPDHLKYPIPAITSTSRSLQEVEKEHILNVLASVDNNKTKAAEILQIDRKTLRNKLK
ncbi:DNA-binding transcriptional response regulator, NtrC family, contains REC, AAA-type ATPase, and a Fis-type DNA-binding domains [Gillisia sp. Hel1_33_143]|uniref:sigma-54-dependent transcriptional regulator n=1 Tax=Gillisia sp. Hel1_33_143 TaxID=1336796 RepID=UPI00087CD248|nr:sigma-54 dependent transcriptional regulator [Gillisia sp. Hel1_33_143]SDS31985.1 DNA-binding transcriptional response regulator, NtrC family, contains REC, AAA-type ATPase, and a Fis-type DNA-binding domains [Gillisia sp. Hel1_33_143]